MEAQMLTSSGPNLMLTFIREAAGKGGREVQVTAIGLDVVDDLLAGKTRGDRAQLALYGARGFNPDRIFDAATDARKKLLRESLGGEAVVPLPLTELFHQIGKAKENRKPGAGDRFTALFLARQVPSQG